MEEEKPNKKFKEICDDIFFNTGEIGVRSLGIIVGELPEPEFERYFKDLENLTKNDKEYEEDQEREM